MSFPASKLSMVWVLCVVNITSMLWCLGPEHNAVEEVIEDDRFRVGPGLEATHISRVFPHITPHLCAPLSCALVPGGFISCLSMS